MCQLQAHMFTQPNAYTMIIEMTSRRWAGRASPGDQMVAVSLFILMRSCFEAGAAVGKRSHNIWQTVHFILSNIAGGRLQWTYNEYKTLIYL